MTVNWSTLAGLNLQPFNYQIFVNILHVFCILSVWNLAALPCGSWIKWMAEKLKTSTFFFFLCFWENKLNLHIKQWNLQWSLQCIKTRQKDCTLIKIKSSSSYSCHFSLSFSLTWCKTKLKEYINYTKITLKLTKQNIDLLIMKHEIQPWELSWLSPVSSCFWKIYFQWNIESLDLWLLAHHPAEEKKIT